MAAIEMIIQSLNRSLEMMKPTLAEMSDTDMLTRPCPGANHPLWQIGHLCVAETKMVDAIKPGAMPELPAGFFEKFENNKKTNLVDDPKQLATKQQVLDLLIKTRGATIAFVKTLSPKDLEQPAPERFVKSFPTVGDLLLLPATHVIMHMGQIQVARRKLGKAIIF
jgi:hypothetical protein